MTYTKKQFAGDLKQLTDLISQYSTGGAAKRSASSAKRSASAAAVKRSASASRSSQRAGAAKRSASSAKRSASAASKRSSQRAGSAKRSASSAKRSASSAKRSASAAATKRSASRSSQRAGAKRLDSDGQPIRKFRVVTVNGKDAPKAFAQRYYSGTKKNNTPGKAALHALSKMPTNAGLNRATGKVTFSLVETTHGSSKKIWGPYVGKFIKLVEARKITRRNPKTGKVASYTVRYKPTVALAGSK